MLKLGLRFGPLLVGLFFVWMSTVAARWGEPPPWSLLAPRETVTVLAATTVTLPVGNGTTRTDPVITVEWPPGSGEQSEIPGLLSLPQRGNAARAAEVVAEHPPGSQITVRVVDGQPMANRQDLFRTLHAGLMAFLGSLVTLIGLALNRALK